MKNSNNWVCNDWTEKAIKNAKFTPRSILLKKIYSGETESFKLLCNNIYESNVVCECLECLLDTCIDVDNFSVFSFLMKEYNCCEYYDRMLEKIQAQINPDESIWRCLNKAIAWVETSSSLYGFSILPVLNNEKNIKIRNLFKDYLKTKWNGKSFTEDNQTLANGLQTYFYMLGYKEHVEITINIDSSFLSNYAYIVCWFGNKSFKFDLLFEDDVKKFVMFNYVEEDFYEKVVGWLVDQDSFYDKKDVMVKTINESNKEEVLVSIGQIDFNLLFDFN